MRIEHLELRWVKIPLVTPFRTSFGTSYDRDTFLLRLVTSDGAEGWAECAAEPDPLYSAEFLAGAEIVLRDQLVPRAVALGDALSATRLKTALEPVTGHPMAKHVLETALLDAELRTADMSFGRYLGAVRDRVPAGVSVGIMDSHDEMLDARRPLPRRRATSGSSSRSSPAGTSSRCVWSASGTATTCCCRSTPTRRTRWPTRATWPGSTPSTCC